MGNRDFDPWPSWFMQLYSEDASLTDGPGGQGVERREAVGLFQGSGIAPQVGATRPAARRSSSQRGVRKRAKGALGDSCGSL